MLSAFRAQTIHELKARDKSKIESILAFGDRLLVGLSSGALRIYRVNEESHRRNDDQDGETDANRTPASPTKSNQRLVELLREEEKFSRRPIQQLAMIKEANLLVSLSDGYISLHDLQTFRLVDRLDQTKGATCFQVTSNVIKDTETGVPSLVSRLAVGVKRKVLCWTWQDMEQLPTVSEFQAEATVKSLVWSTGTRLVMGMDPGFSILNIETHEVTLINKSTSRSAPVAEGSTTELAGIRFGAVSSSGMGYMGMSSWVPKPMTTALSNGQVMLAKDVNTLFADGEGNALEKRQVPWAVAPEAVGYSYPYLLALQQPERGQLQIRNPDTLSLLQTIPVPNASILHVPQPNISLAHAGKGFIVASERVLWRMNALPYDHQLRTLTEKEKYDEAISLLELLEDTLVDEKAGRIREIKILKAIALFHERSFRPALDLFTDAEAPPERVIRLYPKRVAGSLSQIEPPIEVDGTAKSNRDKPAYDESEVPEPNDLPATPSKSLLGRLTGGRGKRDTTPVTPKSTPLVDAEEEVVGRETTPKPTPRNSMEADSSMLEGDDLKHAVRALCSFLVQARTRMQKYLNFDGTLKEDPPTLDPETSRPAFSNLLSPSAFEEDKLDWRSALQDAAQLIDTTLFRAYMLASPSLAGPLFRLDNFCDADVVQSALYETEHYDDLVDFLHGKKLHRQALEMLSKFGRDETDAKVPEALSGPHRTVSYLKQLPPELIELIFEFAQWPFQVEPSVGMEVFTADTDNAENLPRQQVTEFLAALDPELETQYLEHIITELEDQTARFHQRLVSIYLARLSGPSTASSDYSHGDKQKLETHLETSKHYDKVATLRALPADDPTFFEARAIVLSDMGNHKQALSIYAYQLQDHSKAEDYCARLYASQMVEQQSCLLNGQATHQRGPLLAQDEKDNNVFAILLGLYLRPPPGEEKRWPQALDLLSKHGARLPASSTLDLMPDDLQVSSLSSYFRDRMRLSTSSCRLARVTAALEASRKTATERDLLLGGEAHIEQGTRGGRNRMIRIGEEDRCKVCQRRFGASAVRVWPDGEVVHYGCVNRKSGGFEASATSRPNRAWA